MTGISYQATIHDKDMRGKLEALIERMENREGFFKNVGEHLMNSLGDHFDNEESPDGEKWQALSPVTIALRAAKGFEPSPILRASGDFRGSFNMAASNNDVRIGTAKVQAAILHFGGQAGHGRKVTIPARPVLGLSQGDEAAIMENAEDWLAVE